MTKYPEKGLSRSEQRQVNAAYVVIALLGGLAGGFFMGDTVPYLYEGYDHKFRVGAASTAFIAILVGYAFQYVRPWERITRVGFSSGIIFFATLLAGVVFWWSGGFVAALANGTGRNLAAADYEVVSIRQGSMNCTRSSAKRYVELRRPLDGGRIQLKQCTPWLELNAGDDICATQRTSIFGTVVDGLVRGKCSS